MVENSPNILPQQIPLAATLLEILLQITSFSCFSVFQSIHAEFLTKSRQDNLAQESAFIGQATKTVVVAPPPTTQSPADTNGNCTTTMNKLCGWKIRI